MNFVKRLLWSASRRSQYSSDLYYAAWSGDAAAVHSLLSQWGADLNAVVGSASGYGTALVAASAQGYVEIVQALLEKGADVASSDMEDGWRALHWASKNGHREVAQALLANGADVNGAPTKRGYVALILASMEGHSDVVEVLLDSGATDQYSALARAAQNGQGHVVQILLDRGAAADAKDAKLSNLLLLAVEQGQNGVVQTLLENGADVNARWNFRDLMKGEYALMRASELGSL